jgi:hypothetical protein
MTVSISTTERQWHMSNLQYIQYLALAQFNNLAYWATDAVWYWAGAIVAIYLAGDVTLAVSLFAALTLFWVQVLYRYYDARHIGISTLLYGPLEPIEEWHIRRHTLYTFLGLSLYRASVQGYVGEEGERQIVITRILVLLPKSTVEEIYYEGFAPAVVSLLDGNLYISPR